MLPFRSRSRSCTAKPPRSSIKGPRGKSLFVLGLITAMTAWSASGSLRAENLTNAAVPTTMDGGNSTYLFDAYTKEWGNISALLIGNANSNNALTLQNGAVSNAIASGSVGLSIGATATSSGNSLTVTGAGTSLSLLGTSTGRGSIAIGALGTGNSLTLSNGANITSYATTIGTGRSDSTAYGNNNTVLITGAGTTWTATGGFNIGSSGSANSLTVSAGAQITNDGGTVGSGQSANTAFGSNNTVLVTGAGTHWEAVTGSGRITVGSNGSTNTFTLSSGATLHSVQFYIGTGGTGTLGGGSFNTVTLDGAGTVLTNDYQVRIGANGNDNKLLIRNGAKLTGGRPVEDVIAHIGLGTSNRTDLGNRNTITVTGAGSAWEFDSLMIVGEYGSNNLLEILNGGQATVGDLAIGTQAETVAGVTNGSNNSVVVNGQNSQFISTGSGIIGVAGNSGNKLTLLDHGLAKFGDQEADTFSIATGNYLQIDGGFLALFGDQTTVLTNLVAAGTLQVEHDGVWSAAALADVQYQYFAPGADTSAFTGGSYSDLGGYTVITAAATVPEPRSAALLALGASFLGLHWRRRTWRTKSLPTLSRP